MVIIAIYVDDCLITGSEKRVSELIRVLASQFEMQHTGPLKWILSMEVKNTKERFNIHQGLYIEKILEKFNMSDCSPVPTPMLKGMELGRNFQTKSPLQRSHRVTDLLE